MTKFQSTLEKVMPLVAGVRRFGAAALDLAYVAAGRYEGYWENSLMPWDMAAGIVIVREAGGYLCDLKGEEDILGEKSILATNQALHQVLKDLLIHKN